MLDPEALITKPEEKNRATGGADNTNEGIIAIFLTSVLNF